MKLMKSPACDIGLKLDREEFEALKPKLDLLFEFPTQNQGSVFYAYAKGAWLMLIINEKARGKTVSEPEKPRATYRFQGFRTLGKMEDHGHQVANQVTGVES